MAKQILCPACEDSYVSGQSKLGLCSRCERVARVVVQLINLGIIKINPPQKKSRQLILPSHSDFTGVPHAKTHQA